jgi:hypothetical protein
MVQQWRDVLIVQIVEHMYENEDEDWLINMLVQENASIAIATPNPRKSKPRKSPNLAEDRQLGHDKIYVDYFF